MNTHDINRLQTALVLDEAARKADNQFDIMSDVDILKAFNISTGTENTEVYDGSLVNRLLSNRQERPSRSTWESMYALAKSNGLQAAHAAELYFHLKDRYPIRDDTHPDDAPPNIVGAGVAGLGLMADGKGKEEEDCD